MSGEPFVLDLDENPHPVMLAGALEARHRVIAGNGRTAYFYWRGYMQAMADATGCTTAELEDWLDSHEPEPPESMSVPGVTVALPLRRSGSDDPASDGTTP